MNLLSRSRISESKRRWLLLERPGKLASLLGDPGAGRVRGAADKVYAPAVELDEEQHIEPLQRDRLDGEEIDREHALCLRSQKGTPGQPDAFAGRAESRLAQDLRDGRRRDGDAEPVQLARDPLVAPARVLPRQPQHQLAISSPIGGRPLRLEYVQRRATRRRCQRSSVAGVTRSDRQRDRGNNRLAAARKTRSVIVSCGRLVCRRSTESSCRSTTISSSLKSCERGRRNTSWSTQRTTR